MREHEPAARLRPARPRRFPFWALPPLVAAACIDTDLEDEARWDAPWGGTPAPAGPAGPPADPGLGPDGWPSAPEGEADTTPPWLVAASGCASTEVQLAEACASAGPYSVALRLWASEHVTALARVEGTGEVTRSETPSAAHHLVLAPLAADSAVRIAIEIQDRAGLTASAGPIEASTGPETSTVVVNEVLSDPLGLEPHQEFVELLNFGSAPVSLDGYRIADEAGEDLLVAPEPLAPGGYAVVVSDRYVPGADGDPAPAPGTLVIRLSGPIGSAGLRNSGEVVTLRDAEGRVVSGYPALTAPPRAGTSVERVSALAPDGDPANWAPNPAGRSSPGGPNGAR